MPSILRVFFFSSCLSKFFLPSLDLCVSLLLCALDGYVAVVVRYGTCDVPAVSYLCSAAVGSCRTCPLHRLSAVSVDIWTAPFAFSFASRVVSRRAFWWVVSVAVCPLPPTQPDRTKSQRPNCNENSKSLTWSEKKKQLFRFVFSVGLSFHSFCCSDAILIH